jgi:hypothetical protein
MAFSATAEIRLYYCRCMSPGVEMDAYTLHTVA